MNKISLGTTYFNNPDYLLKFIEKNITHVDEMIIVDDGSEMEAINHITFHEKIKLYRVKKDYGFNSHGCRNLIMKKAKHDFVVLMDIDREFLNPQFAFQTFKEKKLRYDTLYRFVAHSEYTVFDRVHISVNDYLISKKHFFSAGGYDEEIIGERWGDREFFLQLKNFGREEIIHEVDLKLTRRPSLHLKGNEKSKLDKYTSVRGTKIVERRIKNPEPNKPILTFEWERLF